MTVLEIGQVLVMLLLVMMLVKRIISSRQCLEREKKQRRQSDQRLAMQYFLGEGLAQADSVPTGMKFALQLISQHWGWSFAAYWEADATLERLHCSETWTEAEAGLEHFETIVRSMVYTEGRGLPGKVWAAVEPATIDDVRVLADFPHPSKAAEAALQGAIAFPLVVANRCIGVLEFMTFSPISLTPGHRQMFTAFGAQIGGFIERKWAERELRTREEWFQLFLTHSPAPAFLQDGEGRYCHVNESFCQLFSRPAEMWLEKTVFDLWPPETAKKLHAHDRMVLAGNGVVQSEEQINALNGETHHWLVFKFPFRNYAGETLLAGIGVDITERIRDQERRDQFFNASRDMLCLAGTDGYYKRINPAFETTLGFSTDELLSRPFIELVHSEDREATTAALQQLGAGPGTIEFENRYRCRNGSYRWIQWRVTSLAGNMISAVARDITERKTRETMLKEWQIRCQYLATAVDGIVWEADPLTMRFTYVSPQAERILGYPIERWMAESTFWKTHLHPADRERACTARILLKTERQARNLEYRMIAADGKTIWFNDLPTVVTEGDHPVKFFGIMRDITDQKRMEQRVREAPMLFPQRQQEIPGVELDLEKRPESVAPQARLLALGQLAGSVAHELRNPLGSIRNALYALKRRLPPTDPELAEYIETAEEETVGANRVIKNLLSIARAEELRIEEVDLSRILVDVHRRVRLPEEIQFYWSLNPEPFLLKADATHLSQVFTNLIQYSALDIERSGEILLTASKTRDLAIITIYDTGPGLSPHDREHLFEPLFSTKAQGLGFSLSISRQIIERHGGELDYVADQGCGAAFCLRLPYSTGKELGNLSHDNAELVLHSLSGGSPWREEV
ncbi:MAG: PAS domain S-box protein [Nitrospirota bacterium]|nr:MAG: PAS domain S-box protein [Nitrospirota bacterium]